MRRSNLTVGAAYRIWGCQDDFFDDLDQWTARHDLVAFEQGLSSLTDPSFETLVVVFAQTVSAAFLGQCGVSGRNEFLKEAYRQRETQLRAMICKCIDGEQSRSGLRLDHETETESALVDTIVLLFHGFAVSLATVVEFSERVARCSRRKPEQLRREFQFGRRLAVRSNPQRCHQRRCQVQSQSTMRQVPLDWHRATVRRLLVGARVFPQARSVVRNRESRFAGLGTDVVLRTGLLVKFDTCQIEGELSRHVVMRLPAPGAMRLQCVTVLWRMLREPFLQIRLRQRTALEEFFSVAGFQTLTTH